MTILKRTVNRLAAAAAAVSARTTQIAIALFALAGAGLVSYGVWRIHEEAGFITLGVLLLYAGWDVSRAE